MRRLCGLRLENEVNSDEGAGTWTEAGGKEGRQALEFSSRNSRHDYFQVRGTFYDQVRPGMRQIRSVPDAGTGPLQKVMTWRRLCLVGEVERAAKTDCLHLSILFQVPIFAK